MPVANQLPYKRPFFNIPLLPHEVDEDVAVIVSSTKRRRRSPPPNVRAEREKDFRDVHR